MNDPIVETLKQGFETYDTQILIEIWQMYDQAEWTSEAFEAIRQILLSRLPPTTASIQR
jgi:hypothetical protein